MRWTSRSWRGYMLLWGMLVVLLFGLVFMHHAPSHGGHDAGPAAVSTAGTGSGMAMAESPAQDCSCPAVDHGAAAPGGSGGPGSSAVLHLCLAVLAAVGGVLAAGLVLRGTISSAGANIGSVGRRLGLEYLRPPVPVPRRLATLCVLRL